jgi:ubiquitin-conjugating enzyme E2 D/E
MDDRIRKKINKELKDIENDNNISNISVGLVLNNIFKLKAIILGPIGTPYEGGIFKIFISIPKYYPLEHPTIIFKTKIYHPNIGSDGSICSNIFQTEWSPVFNISTILLYISSILSKPDLNNVSNPEIANILQNNPEIYTINAKKWTKVYA